MKDYIFDDAFWNKLEEVRVKNKEYHSMIEKKIDNISKLYILFTLIIAFIPLVFFVNLLIMTQNLLFLIPGYYISLFTFIIVNEFFKNKFVYPAINKLVIQEINFVEENERKIYNDFLKRNKL